MNIRGALLERVAQDMIQRRDDWRGGRVELLCFGRQKLLVPEVDGEPARRQLFFRRLEAGFQAIEGAVQRFHVAPRRDDALHIQAGDATDSSTGNGASGSSTATVRVVLFFDIAMSPWRRANGPGQRGRDDVEVEVERVDFDETQA